MKKLLIMANGLYGGGAEKILQNILNNLDYSKYDVTVYTMYPEKLDANIFINPRFKTKSIFIDSNNKIKGKSFQLMPSELFWKIYVKENFDIAVSFIEGESTKILSGSKGKKFAWVHTDMINNPWTEYMYKSTEDECNHYKKYDKIVCVSEAVRNAFLKKFDISPDKVIVLHNPVDSVDIQKKAAASNDIADFDGITFVSVGRMEKEKGVGRLVPAAAKLQEKGYKFRFLIVGSGSLEQSIKDEAARLGVEDEFIFCGFQSNPYPYINKADALVCSSYSEGFSTVATEAVILGKPVLTTDCPGMSELFGDRQCGIICPNTDEGIAEMLDSVLKNPEILNSFSENSVERSSAFSIKATMRDIEALIDEKI